MPPSRRGPFRCCCIRLTQQLWATDPLHRRPHGPVWLQHRSQALGERPSQSLLLRTQSSLHALLSRIVQVGRDVEGSLFLVQRSSAPFFQFVVLNKKSVSACLPC